MNARLSLFLIASLLFFGCGRHSPTGFDQAKLQDKRHKGAIVRIADHTAFAWDRFHVFPPYAPSSIIRKEVGREVPFPNRNSENHCLLVFLKGDRIEAAFEQPRTPIDFAGLYRRNGYPPQEATFVVNTRPSDDWHYLENQPKTHP